MPATLLTAKVIGTVTIGLWAGYNVSLIPSSGHQTLATVSRSFKALTDKLGIKCSGRVKGDTSIPVATQSSPSQILELLSRNVGIAALSGVSFVAHLFSYFGANRSGKHPYLLYLALGAPLVGALQWYGARELEAQINHASSTPKGEKSNLSESVYEHISPSGGTSTPTDTSSNVSLETVERKFELYALAVAALSSSLYLISVVGLAGDNF